MSNIIVKYIIVFFVSMVPLIELRGAIPIAEGLGLNILLYYPISIIGNILPVPVIFLFAISNTCLHILEADDCILKNDLRGEGIDNALSLASARVGFV